MLCTAGFIFLTYGLVSLIGASAKPGEIIIDSQESDKNESKISVDVEGAVMRPGLYNLPSSSRVKDALVAAGGVAQEADRDWLAKKVNLAAKLTDGGKIYILKVGEEPISSGDSIGITVQGAININTADSATLDTLPGVGKVTSEKIIGNRPYSSIEDLVSKKVIGSSAFEKLKDKITVN